MSNLSLCWITISCTGAKSHLSLLTIGLPGFKTAQAPPSIWVCTKNLLHGIGFGAATHRETNRIFSCRLPPVIRATVYWTKVPFLELWSAPPRERTTPWFSKVTCLTWWIHFKNIKKCEKAKMASKFCFCKVSGHHLTSKLSVADSIAKLNSTDVFRWNPLHLWVEYHLPKHNTNAPNLVAKHDRLRSTMSKHLFQFGISSAELFLSLYTRFRQFPTSTKR